MKKGADFVRSRRSQWLAFFQHPEHYWDNRGIKLSKSASSADFRHVDDGTSLWIDSADTWVKEKLKELATPTSSKPVRACYVNASGRVQERTPVDTLLCDLKTCGYSRDLARGRELEEKILEAGLDDRVFLMTALLDMYARCGSLDDAFRCFNKIELSKRDSGCWNELMMGYIINGDPETALRLFSEMRRDKQEPKARSLIVAVVACSQLARSNKLDPARADEVHELAKEMKLDNDTFVANNLITMYGNCGDMETSQAIFNGLKEPDVVSWNSLLAGYINHREYEKAVQVYEALVAVPGAVCNARTYTLVMKACSEILAYVFGVAVHKSIQGSGVEVDAILATTLLHFYGLCGDVHAAQEYFDSLPPRLKDDVGVCNALLQGYCLQGDAKMAFHIFSLMEERKVEADAITFVVMLSACSHSGLVDEAKRLFKMMSKYRLEPGIEHWSCMIGACARQNMIAEALRVLKQMEEAGFEADEVAWTTILTAATRFGNSEAATLAFQALRSIIPQESASYRLMETFYRKEGKADDLEKVQLLRRQNCKDDRHVTRSWWTSDDGHVHEYFPTTKTCYLSCWMHQVRTRSNQMERRAGDKSGCSHSELLAIADAVHETRAGTTIRIFKKMRTC